MKLRGLEIVAAIAALGLIFWMILTTQAPESPAQQVDRLWKSQLAAVQRNQASGIELPDINLPCQKLDDLALVADRVTSLNLAGEDLATKLDRVVSLTHLKVLHLRTRLGDAEVNRLAQLPELEVLDLPLALDLTDSGLAALAHHPRLKLLRLRKHSTCRPYLVSLKSLMSISSLRTPWALELKAALLGHFNLYVIIAITSRPISRLQSSLGYGLLIAALLHLRVLMSSG